jgi:hypothetical protein
LQVKEVNTYLKSLEASKKIKGIKQKRGVFYQLSQKHLQDDD